MATGVGVDQNDVRFGPNHHQAPNSVCTEAQTTSSDVTIIETKITIF